MNRPHKRSAADREVTFHAPNYKCHACNDSGFVHNSDGLLNDYIPDYDINEQGKRVGGSDLAVICWCEAAYPSYKTSENEIATSGYRDSGGIRNNLGISIDKEIIRELHFKRKENWKRTSVVMNKLRLSSLKGEKVQLPEYIQTVKKQLAKVPDLLNAL